MKLGDEVRAKPGARSYFGSDISGLKGTVTSPEFHNTPPGYAYMKPEDGPSVFIRPSDVEAVEHIGAGMKTNKLEDIIRYVEDDTSYGIAKAISERFIVIDRDDLPEVERVEMHDKFSGTFRFAGSMLERVNYEDDHLLLVRAHLAAAEYMEQHPNLAAHEKAIAELAEVLKTYGSFDGAARRLIADGWARKDDS